jgi:hypothetical protein
MGLAGFGRIGLSFFAFPLFTFQEKRPNAN